MTLSNNEVTHGAADCRQVPFMGGVPIFTFERQIFTFYTFQRQIFTFWWSSGRLDDLRQDALIITSALLPIKGPRLHVLAAFRAYTARIVARPSTKTRVK